MATDARQEQFLVSADSSTILRNQQLTDGRLNGKKYLPLFAPVKEAKYVRYSGEILAR